MNKDKREEYYNIKDIFGPVPEISINVKKGAKLRFPIYMTETLANTEIEALELSERSKNCLRRSEIRTIGDLCDRVHSSSDLMSLRNCGKTSIAEIMDKLFLYQYSILSPKRRGKFLAEVVEMNVVAGVDKNGN